jgi:hypothetical protein
MYRLLPLTLVGLWFISALNASQSKRPELPFFDWNACPFEGCTYGQWTAKKPVVVYDTWKKTRKSVTRVAVGDKVTAVTGVVITYKPGIIRIDNDLPGDQGLKRGDIIYTYAYRGEATWAVWINGVYHDAFGVPSTHPPDDPRCAIVTDCTATELQHGEKEWWAKIKLKSGKTVWVNMDKEFEGFDGVDLLG